MEMESRKLRSIDYTKGLKIIFDPNVRITKSNLTITPMTLFSNIGGCVGLTLGFSLLQILEKLGAICNFFKKKLTNAK